jgi:transposase-like protein
MTMVQEATGGLGSISGRSKWSEVTARRVLAAWEASGESVSSFARRHKVNAERITWWRDRLGAPAPLTLVPMTPTPTRGASTGSASVVLRVCDDLQFEIDAACVSPQWCAALAVALTREGA